VERGQRRTFEKIAKQNPHEDDVSLFGCTAGKQGCIIIAIETVHR
jgi:hypothetical protein